MMANKIKLGNSYTLSDQTDLDFNLMSNKNFILFSFDYVHLGSGISRLCTEIVKGIKQKLGRQPLVVTYDFAGSAISSPVENEFKTPSARPWREISAVKFLLKKRKSNSVVLCATWYPEGLLCYLSNIRPYVILAHGTEILPARQKFKRMVWERLKKTVLNNADMVIANSNYTANLTRQFSKLAKIKAIPLGVDIKRFSPGDREKAKQKFGVSNKTVISTIARIFKYKGHETVLNAIALLPEDYRRKMVYLIAGWGPYKDNLRDLAKKMNIDSIVRFTGDVPEEDLPDLYRASDLFVLCSEEEYENQNVEGFGLVFLEAQACATPVVGTISGGIPDAVSVENGGKLIKEKDSKALSEILRDLVDNPGKFQEMGSKLRAHVVKNCTWENYTDRFIKEITGNSE